MKFYRVIFTSIDIDEADHTIIITTFFDKENVLKYYKEQLKDLRKQQEELNMENYGVDADETSYERACYGTVSSWLEEDHTCDELVL